jgi:hypothetical protein
MGRPLNGKGGRTSGSGQLVDRLRVAVSRSLGELERRKTPLHILLADSFQKDAAKTLTAIRGLLPQEIKSEVLTIHEMHLDAVRSLSRTSQLPAPMTEPMPVIIDAEPVKSDQNVSSGCTVIDHSDAPSDPSVHLSQLG